MAKLDELSELRALVDVLQGALLVEDMQLIDEAPTWAKPLTPQQRAFMGMLLAAAPKAVDRWDALERLPGLDHVLERNLNCVNTLVYEIRRKLGRDAIETVAGGYRLGSAFRQADRRAA